MNLLPKSLAAIAAAWVWIGCTDVAAPPVTTPTQEAPSRAPTPAPEPPAEPAARPAPPPTPGERCAASKACAERGACAYISDTEERFFPTLWATGIGPDGEKECSRSGGVTDAQRLQEDFGCYPTTDAHCEQSRGCREGGRCVLLEPDRWRDPPSCTTPATLAFEKDCSRTTDCLVYGKCTRLGTSCIVGPEQDCADTPACERHGRCERVGGRCLATEDSHCRDAANTCTFFGRCTAQDGECVATTASCRASTGCTNSGACSVREGRCERVTDADCRRSKLCKERRLCHLASDGSCYDRARYGGREPTYQELSADRNPYGPSPPRPPLGTRSRR